MRRATADVMKCDASVPGAWTSWSVRFPLWSEPSCGNQTQSVLLYSFLRCSPAVAPSNKKSQKTNVAKKQLHTVYDRIRHVARENAIYRSPDSNKHWLLISKMKVIQPQTVEDDDVSHTLIRLFNALNHCVHTALLKANKIGLRNYREHKKLR